MSDSYHEELPFWRKYIFSRDHKIIGIQFLFSGMFFALVGGGLAMLVRTKLAWPTSSIPFGEAIFGWPGGVMGDQFYNMAFTMHASVMIFLVIIPGIPALGNFALPIML